MAFGSTFWMRDGLVLCWDLFLLLETGKIQQFFVLMGAQPSTWIRCFPALGLE